MTALLARKASLEHGLETISTTRPRTAHDAIRRQRIARQLAQALALVDRQLGDPRDYNAQEREYRVGFSRGWEAGKAGFAAGLRVLGQDAWSKGYAAGFEAA